MKLTQILELDIKAMIITVFHMFKKLENPNFLLMLSK